MTTENNKDIVLDEMMEVWDNMKATKKEYISHGINIDDLYPEETKRFLSYIRFDKQCIIMKREYMKNNQVKK
jgi:hypothetical protein